MSDDGEKMGFHATWAMGVGGMVGGGIFAVLGVVTHIAGGWAWLSFLLAGLLALITGHSYVGLARVFRGGGGTFTHLRQTGHRDFAGSLAWLLILGYMLTLSVYATTFGSYIGHALGLGPWFIRVAAASIIGILTMVNLLGVGAAANLEIGAVWIKLAVLLGLACIGLWWFNPDAVGYPEASPGGGLGVLVGAAAVFMAFQGFEMLVYDYADIHQPRRTLPSAVPWAIVSTLVVYLLVALGAMSLVGAPEIVEHEQSALAVAGQAALGTTGLVLITVAAAFSTASAINATLFAAARLMQRIAGEGQLPRRLANENASGVPAVAVVVLGVVGGGLALVGGLSTLVEAASLAFLFAFCTVNLIAAQRLEHRRWLGWVGAVASGLAGLTLAARLAVDRPWMLAVLVAVVVVAVFVRPWLLRHTATKPAPPADAGAPPLPPDTP